ncbi:MAG TPA: SDR family NAD(P)-dependent oxidoreductase [Candidatus Dormibacteraeota bacterium]|nr:SDR family NAD(P)-dependent oxidoreductase [Candidatus Dormibacteraeota bacterium]
MTITLVTGANRGLGYETARQLIEAGHIVYIGSRSRSNAERAAGELQALALVIDVTDDASVRAAADLVEAERGRLDVLVNNAGIAGVRRPLPEITASDAATVFDTNVVGIVRVMHAFLPLLRRSERGVVVNVGSGLGSFAHVHDPARIEFTAGNLAYNASKAAVSMLTVQYARAFPDLRINVVDPGYTATDLNGFRGTQSVVEGAAPIVSAALLTGDGPTGAFLDAAGDVPW